MATTNISTEIVSITGVTAHGASDDFIVSAQKFVAASVPKELLRWAASETVPATHGGDADPQQVTIPTGTDSIISVRRDSFVAQEVGIEDRGFIANSNSLQLATNTFPKYFVADANRIIVKPDPDSTYKIYVTYVDYSNLDDDSDLRNAVIYHACSSELSKLSTAELPTVSIAAVPPDVPSLTTVTFSSTDSDLDASAPTFTTATVSAGGVFGANTAPAYSKPTLTTPVSFEDFFSGTEDLNPFGDSDPGVLSVSVSAPSISIVSSGITTTAAATITANTPDYAPPVVSGDNQEITGPIVAGSTGTAGDRLNFQHWYDVLADMIEDEEDTELASIQLQKINSYIGAYQAAIQNNLNTFNEQNVKYQASVQAQIQAQQHLAAKNTQSATQTMEALIQDTQLELQKYQAQVNDEVQEYSQKLSRYQLEMNTAFQAWQITEANRLSQYQADIQNEVNEFNKENVSFQANIQEGMQEIQVANQADMAKLQASLQVAIDNENRSQQRQLQNGVNDMQAIVASNQDSISKYQSELQQYSGEVQAEVSEYQNKIQKQQALSKEADKYYQWAKTEVTTYIQNNSKMIAATMSSQSSRAQA